MKKGECLTMLYELPAGLQAPLKQDEVVGKVHYTINGQTLMTESLTVGVTVYKMELQDYYRMTAGHFLVNH